MLDAVVLVLPYPPTVNHYYRLRRGGKGLCLSPAAEQYRIDCFAAVQDQGAPRIAGRLLLEADIYPPDQQERDIDNLGKGLFDALQACGVFPSDRLVDCQRFTRRESRPPRGLVIVRISKITPEILENPILAG